MTTPGYISVITGVIVYPISRTVSHEVRQISSSYPEAITLSQEGQIVVLPPGEGDLPSYICVADEASSRALGFVNGAASIQFKAKMCYIVANASFGSVPAFISAKFLPPFTIAQMAYISNGASMVGSKGSYIWGSDSAESSHLCMIYCGEIAPGYIDCYIAS